MKGTLYTHIYILVFSRKGMGVLSKALGASSGFVKPLHRRYVLKPQVFAEVE